VKRLDLYLQFDRPLSAEELAEFKARLRRRLRHEPLQYIEGRAEFRHLSLHVDRRVLIPRPETEVLVGEVLAWVAGRENLDVADIGTGSGAIALSLRQEGAFGRVIATDSSPDALRLAEENAGRTGMTGRIDFRLGDALAPLGREHFHVIVSNPPYVAESDRLRLGAGVEEWEPHDALFGGEDGLELIRRIVAGAPAKLRPGGLLALEIGPEQWEMVAELVRETNGFDEPVMRRDLAGRERFMLAELRGRD